MIVMFYRTVCRPIEARRIDMNQMPCSLALSTLLPTTILTTPSPQYVSISRNHLTSSSNVLREDTS
jgi:hypothetical protein